MVCGTSTGVNLTDGLDGLAAGASIPALGAYVIIGIWEFRNDCTVLLMNNCYTVRDPLDIAVVASSVMGACWGFLWWNAPPAKIFMGDTGSHQQIPASRSPQTHSDGSDIRLHHYCRSDGRRVGAVVRAQRPRAGDLNLAPRTRLPSCPATPRPREAQPRPKPDQSPLALREQQGSKLPV
jgi:hypothetical protein